jgi:hypothetical protein
VNPLPVVRRMPETEDVNFVAPDRVGAEIERHMTEIEAELAASGGFASQRIDDNSPERCLVNSVYQLCKKAGYEVSVADEPQGPGPKGEVPSSFHVCVMKKQERG